MEPKDTTRRSDRAAREPSCWAKVALAVHQAQAFWVMIVHSSFAAMESLFLSQMTNAVAITATLALTNHAATTL